MFNYLSRAKPVVKWAGGKSSLLPTLIATFPQSFERYIEPFLGGGSVFLALSNKIPAIINDSNQELFVAYEAVKSIPEKLMNQLDLLSEKYSEKLFYEMRESTPQSLIARAARTIFLNKTCFNGLYRTNAKGKFNVPFGKRARCPALYERQNFLKVSELLKRADITNFDFEEVIARAKEGDLVYCDPPYIPLSKTAYFSAYTPRGFSWEDQKRLKAACDAAAKRGAFVVVSNSSAPQAKELYSDWDVAIVQAARCINSKGSRRGAIDEVLAIRNPNNLPQWKPLGKKSSVVF